jgi:hypothetical protein
MGGRRRICAATFAASGRGFADWLSGSAAGSLDGGSITALAAAGDVLPDGTGFAAMAREDPQGTGWDCAKTAIASSGRSSRGFIDGLAGTTFVRLNTIMERREGRLG